MRHGPPLAVRLVIHVAVWGLAITMLLPFLWMLSTALKTDLAAIGSTPQLLPAGWPSQWHWENFSNVWAKAHLGRYYINSTIVAIATTILAGAHCALAGFAFAKLRFRGRQVTFGLLLATMMLPFQVSFIFAYVICGWIGYVDNYQALIVPFLASAFGIFYMRQAISTVHDDLLHAGRIDGMSDAELFLNIIVPTVRPAIAALAIFTFMGSWNSFFWPLIVVDSNDMYTLPLAVNALAGQYYTDSRPEQMAAATLITIPVLLVFMMFQRSFVRGLALTGVKG